MAFKNTLIKCLIWLGFLFVNSAITTGLVYAGVLLGAIPTVLLFAVACYATRSCCKAYDRKHAPLPSAADTGEEPKSISPADGAAAEEPAERQENREEAKMGEIIQLPKAKSVQPEQPVKENKPRRVSQKPVLLTLGTGGRAYCILLLARVSSAMRAEKPVGGKQIHHRGFFLPPNG